MPLTDEIPVVLDALVELLGNSSTLDLKDVFYGNEEKIPRTPAVTVAMANKRRVPYQTGLNYTILFTGIVDVFHSRYASKQLTRRECDEFAEQVQDELHSDLTLGGLLINSYVASIEPGILSRQNTLMMATRLTWEAQSRKRIT